MRLQFDSAKTTGYAASERFSRLNPAARRFIAKRASRALRCVVVLAVLAASSDAQSAERPAGEASEAPATAIGQASATPSAHSGPPSASVAAEVKALLSRAAALQETGFRFKAIDQLERASSLVNQLADPALGAATAGALGGAYLCVGTLDAARSQLQKALGLAEQASAASITAATLNDWGNLLSAEQREKDALAAYRRSLDLAYGSGNFALSVAAAQNAAQLELKSKNVASTLEWLGVALQSLDKLSDSREKAAGLLRTGRLFQDAYAMKRDPNVLAQAYANLSGAARTAEAHGDWRLASYAWGHMGQLYEDEKRIPEALDLTRKAVFFAQQAQAPESLYRWKWQAGRLFKAEGKIQEALDSYRHAIQNLSAIRHDLMAELRAQRASYREAVGPLFLEFADLLLRRSAAPEAAQDAQQNLREARDLIEQLKAVELEDYFQDDCVSGLVSKQKAVEEVAPRTAVLYPIIFPDRIELLIGFSTGLERVTLKRTAQALAKEVLAFRQRLEKRTTHEYLPYARRLYDWLIRPIEAQLQARQVDTLVLVPDGPLRSIPFAALNDGASFLVGRYALAVVPGLTLIEPQAIARQEMRLLVNGLTRSVQNFPALPYVSDEIQAIQGRYSGKLLQDEGFLIANVERELKRLPYSVVHIASHGQFDSDPRKSFLLTYDGRLSMDQLEQLMKFSRFREDPVELLTLSACRTAAGDDRAALGLAGVAIKAGARSALATLWYINDQASTALVTEFYEQLGLASNSKAKALQKAQQKLLSDPRYRHPGYWSPFLMIGNWL